MGSLFNSEVEDVILPILLACFLCKVEILVTLQGCGGNYVTYIGKICVNQILKKMFAHLPQTLDITFTGVLGQARMKKVRRNSYPRCHWSSNPGQAKWPARWGYPQDQPAPNSSSSP